jgi:hypothetical protein
MRLDYSGPAWLYELRFYVWVYSSHFALILILIRAKFSLALRRTLPSVRGER